MTTPIFPYLPGITYPVDRTAGLFDTVKQVAASGKETRFARQTQARYRYTLEITGLDSRNRDPTLGLYSKQIFEGFYNSLLGGALIFNFWDTEDNTVVNGGFGTGDGTTTQFQLGRPNQGSFDNIFAPILSGGTVYVQPGSTLTPAYAAPLIYNNGSLVSSSAYSISSSGIVTFNAAPGSGAALTWTGCWFWPCNFDDDSLDLSNIWFGVWSAKKVTFTTRVF